MKIKRRHLTIILTVTGLIALFFIIYSLRLQGQLEQSQVEQLKLSEKINSYSQIEEIDSLLLKGDYNSAIKSYATKIDLEKEHKIGIPLRIALAEKLLQEKEAYSTFSNTKIDTAVELADTGLNLPEEIRKFDSLNFSLEKTKVQLARLKKQLQQKSFGEYLNFTSKKGSLIHYVGQVKNGKANGFGIALLDTGSRYEGEWKDNMKQGEGTFYWPDGEFYKGAYEDDKRNGYGIYYWPNGDKYAGDWEEDKRSGTGKFFNTDGTVVASGDWKDDKLVDVNDK